MSSSEHDASESSNMGSPQLHAMDSPYSSPAQQVPHLANILTELTCADTTYNRPDNVGIKPFLRFIEQPQNHFRFRYKSEMIGTHGCLLGKSYAINKAKTHPTVELVNYSGRALIRCRLAQNNNEDEHPHKLLEDEQEDKDVSTEVPEQGSYKVGFAGMGIIHTAKKDVPGLLYKKYIERMKNAPFNAKEIRMHCENLAKSINLNIVRLRFSAHDIVTDREICPPIYSEPIHNMKSAATNDLKICRISRYTGRPRGGDDVYILVEKVNKKNIEIRFYELSPSGDECWSAKGNFLQSDVHHQYAIVFRTPAYKDPEITKDVKVYIELVRPSDGRTSEPKEFVYKAEQVFKQSKKRKANSSYSSLDSSSGGSIKSISEVPTTVAMASQMNNINNREDEVMNDVSMCHFQAIPQIPQAPSNSDLGDALYVMASESQQIDSQAFKVNTGISPMLSQPNVPDAQSIHLTSSEFNQLLRENNHMPSEERKRFLENDYTEYFRSFGEDLPDGTVDTYTLNSMDFLRSSLVADSARTKPAEKTSSNIQTPTPKSTFNEEAAKINIAEKKMTGSSEYSATYKSEDGVEVKKLVMEVCNLIRKKTGCNKQTIKIKLEKLFDIRLSNGDTFLHMTLHNNQPSMEYLVKIIYNIKMTHLLNLSNNKLQTILHYAIMNDSPQMVSFLVSKGCNPTIKDNDGNNAIHYAVMCMGSCLEPLLQAIKNNKVSCSLNDYNNDKQSALHLAAVYGSEGSTRQLLQHGASYNIRDGDGRTPLHLAAYDDSCLPVIRTLLEFIPPSDIDAVDGQGNTALQIVCGREIKSHTPEIVKMLLEREADPMRCESHNDSAWKLSYLKTSIKDIIKDYVKVVTYDEDIKSEPEDEFESADESMSQETGLQELPLYIRELCAVLDASGGWRALAARLRHDALLNWFENTRSPTYTLLTQTKECDDYMTSKSLAMLLEDIKEFEAASIIRKYITD